MNALVCFAVLSMLATTAFAATSGDDLECVVCGLLVKQAEKSLASNKTETEVLADLEKACDILGSLKAKCVTDVDAFGKQIIQLLVNKEDPTTVCKGLGLCKTNTTKVASGNDIDCVLCSFLVKEAEHGLQSNKSQQEILSDLEKACDMFGSMKAACIKDVSTYAPILVHALVNHEDPATVCKSLDLCKNATATAVVPKPQVKAGGDLECVICGFIVKEAEHALQNNKTETEVLNDLEKACDILGSLKKNCIADVQKNGPIYIAKLINKESPAVICKSMNMCKNATLAVDSETKCAVCEVIVGTVDKAVKSNKTDAEIMKDLQDVCAVMRKYRNDCDSVVNEYVPAMIAMLVNKEDPEQVCAKLKLCTSSRAAAIANAFKPMRPLRRSNETCVLCEDVVTYAEAFLKKHPNITEPELVAEIDKLCKILPGNESVKCDSVVKDISPIIFPLLKHGASPQLVCKVAKMCEKATAPLAAPPATPFEAAAEDMPKAHGFRRGNRHGKRIVSVNV